MWARCKSTPRSNTACGSSASPFVAGLRGGALQDEGGAEAGGAVDDALSLVLGEASTAQAVAVGRGGGVVEVASEAVGGLGER
jgi:hypothetical protein